MANNWAVGDRVVMKDQWPGVEETTERVAGSITEVVPGNPDDHVADAVRFTPDGGSASYLLTPDAFNAETPA